MKSISDVLRKNIRANLEEPITRKNELIGSLFFLGVSIILTTLNIVKRVDISMTVATSILVIGFAVSSLLSYKKKLTAAKFLIMLLCGVIFTMFALAGGNDGFAILWIILVPLIGPLWIGIRHGIVLSAYFQLFLFVLMYSPLSKTVAGYYSETFLLRFPLLYFATFGAVTFMLLQREELLRKLYKESYYDALTGLRNRRYYNEYFDEWRTRELGPDFTFFSFDLNRLKYANDTYGHRAGDEILKATAEIIERNFNDAYCFRIGGDEFVAFSENIDIEKSLAGLNKDIASWKGEFMESVSISVGYSSIAENPGMTLEELAVLADRRMYREKDRFYDENDFIER